MRLAQRFARSRVAGDAGRASDELARVEPAPGAVAVEPAPGAVAVEPSAKAVELGRSTAPALHGAPVVPVVPVAPAGRMEPSVRPEESVEPSVKSAGSVRSGEPALATSVASTRSASGGSAVATTRAQARAVADDLLGEAERGYRLRVGRLRGRAGGAEELMLGVLAARAAPVDGRAARPAQATPERGQPSGPPTSPQAPGPTSARAGDPRRRAHPGTGVASASSGGEAGVGVSAGAGREAGARVSAGAGGAGAREVARVEVEPRAGTKATPGPRTEVEVVAQAGYEVRRVVTPLDRPWPELLGGALAGVKVPDAAAWMAIAGKLAPAGASGGPPAPVGDERAPFVVLDTETTGLAHDAGTLAFLVGLAWLRGDALVVEQWLLQRLGAEAAMLRALVARVGALRGATGALVTYNGASFDLPLLRARLRRCGVEDTGLGGLHLDLLVLARRIWRTPGVDLRLGAVERARLGVRRQGDVPGHAIPAAFWSWLEAPTAAGPAALLERVLAHNAADLITLPAVGRALAASIEAPADLAASLRVARHHVARGAPREALASLGPWLPDGRGLSAPTGAGRPARPGPVGDDERRAWLLAAGLLVREGEVRQAAALLESICARERSDAPVHEALARLLEHRLGDPEAALAVLRRSTGPVSPPRLERLARKVALRSAPALIPRGS